MSDNLDNTSLDDLFKEARRALHGQQVGVAKAKEKAGAAPATPEDPYHSSAWVKTRGVALIHEETHTVLGNFTEYTNRFIPGARRLVRELEVPAVRVVEYVTGVWGEPTPEPVRSTRVVEGWRTLEISLNLAAMKVQTGKTQVKAFFADGTLTRVELLQDTTFASNAPGEYFHLLCLPTGSNVLPQLPPASIDNLLTTLGQPT